MGKQTNKNFVMLFAREIYKINSRPHKGTMGNQTKEYFKVLKCKKRKPLST